ncbi:MAG: hypothetical protein GY861_14905 [bacterium]|nr:hypothetical protein [bacterium]
METVCCVLEERCPRCNSQMYDAEVDIENLTEYEEASFIAGLWRPFYCPGCKTTHHKG